MIFNYDVSEIDGRFILWTVSGTNINEFLLNACTDFSSKGIDRVCPVRYTWSNHDYYQGTMNAVGPNVFFELSATDKTYYGKVNTETQVVTVTDLKGSISAVSYDETSAIDNCNDAPYGLSTYDITTSNTPVANTYGVLHYFRSQYWQWQIAISTDGREFIRRNINDNGWTSWDEIVNKSKYAFTEFTVTSSSQKVTSLYGYTENGVVFVKAEFVAGLAAGWHNDITLSIPSQYLPRASMYGTLRRNGSTDFNNQAYAQLGTNGSLQLGLYASNNASLPVQFVYPLKST